MGNSTGSSGKFGKLSSEVGSSGNLSAEESGVSSSCIGGKLGKSEKPSSSLSPPDSDSGKESSGRILPQVLP